MFAPNFGESKVTFTKDWYSLNLNIVDIPKHSVIVFIIQTISIVFYKYCQDLMIFFLLKWHLNCFSSMNK